MTASLSEARAPIDGTTSAPGTVAVIFDCDGVLIDSELMVCRIAAEELTRLGYPITTEDVIRRFAGRPDREMRAEIEAEWGRPIPESYRTSMDRRTLEAYAGELRMIPGVVDAIDAIRAMRIPFCVASSSGPHKLRLGLETVGLYHRFAPNVISAALVARGKPEPDVFLFAAGWIKASPLSCIVVEDSVPGVTAAARAGMRVLGFTGGSHSHEQHAGELIAAGASAVISDMKELPALVEDFARSRGAVRR